MTTPRIPILALLLLTAGSFIAAQTSPLDGDFVYSGVNTNRLWEGVSSPPNVDEADRIVRPDNGRLVSIDWAIMDAVVEKTTKPLRDDERKVITLMAFPMPGGGTETFEIWNDPIMHADLAAKFPEINTYAGRSTTDPTASIRLDVTPQGVHGQILRDRGTVYLDPYAMGNNDVYVSYNRRNFSPHPSKVWQEAGPLNIVPCNPDASLRASGEQLRTYRLALACTGQYAAFHGGTVAAALGAMTTTMNRVNGIYERDFSVRMELIADNDLLIYLDADTDPYTNFNGSAMLNQNQLAIDDVIGNPGYDVGHVFSTGGGGIASLGSVCDPSQKARGVTGLPSPIGDPFDVDYVCHELGHQFRGEHSWNYCGGPFGTGSTDFEPGSGSTIMGYAGLCGSDDVVNLSDDYFHGGNVTQMVAFITTGLGSTCGVVTSTANDPPVIEAVPEGFTIPGSTPFQLTATASDAQNDALTYCWEQIDGLNNISLTSSPTGVFGAPLFRSFLPKTDPTRVFPSLDLLVPGNTSRVEYLADYDRSMRFQITVRDNRPGGGGVAWDDVTVQVDASGPAFTVTEPAGPGVVWETGEWVPVSWDVAGTDAAPFDCATVRIELSTDGGFTYPYVLAEGLPNNGSNFVPVPEVETTNARVRVSCNENIFFNLNDQVFRIEDTQLPSGIAGIERLSLGLYPNPATDFVTVQLGANQALTGPVSVRLMDYTGRAIWQQELAYAGAEQSIRIPLADMASGLYAVEIQGQGGVLAARTLMIP